MKRLLMNAAPIILAEGTAYSAVKQQRRQQYAEDGRQRQTRRVWVEAAVECVGEWEQGGGRDD